MLYIHLALVAAGIGFCTRKAVLFGNRAIIRPVTTYIGILLIFQLPVAYFANFMAGAAEGAKLAQQGVTELSPGTAKRIADKLAWVSPAVAVVFVGMAFVAGVLGQKPLPDDVPEPESDVAGVRDFVAERAAADDEAGRRRNAWAGDSTAT